MIPADRRYDIDWLRVIAIGLLIVYHIAIIFQPWAKYIGFIQSEEPNSAIWVPMALINIWRIPLLFMVSGMGVCFALRRRDWKQLLADRAKRILLPLVFGSFFIVPIHTLVFQSYYSQELVYSPALGHLWFLLNICLYISQIIGVAFLDKNYDYAFFNLFRRLLERPYFIFLFIIPVVLEAELIDPEYYSLYVGTGHGFVLGMIVFFYGFLFTAIGEPFWRAVGSMKLICLLLAGSLFLMRWQYFALNGPHFLTATESMCWIFALLGYGHAYLNKPGKLLAYLSPAVYPVYIIHMIFLYLGAMLVLPRSLPVEMKFVLIIVVTAGGCFALYELLIKRINILRPLFGLKAIKRPGQT